MSKLRKNVDLESLTIAVLQVEGTMQSFGSLKPFLEKILNDVAQKAIKDKPEVYRPLLASKSKAISKKAATNTKRSNVSRRAK